MFCKYCGEQISYTSKWCGHCGKEAPSLYRYRKAVHRKGVHNSNAKPADSSFKSAESGAEGPGSAGDLKSFMESTVAVNEAKPVFDGEATQTGGSAYYGEATQAGGSAYYGEATQAGSSAYYGKAAQADGSAYQNDAGDWTSAGMNPAASFNRSGDLVGYPGEDEINPGAEKAKKKPHKKKASRKSVHIIAGIASVVLIAGLVGFGLGRIFPKTARPGTDDLVESAAESKTTEPEGASHSGEGDAQSTTSSADGKESRHESAESGITESGESGSGDGQDQVTGKGDATGTGGGVNHDTRDVVSEAVADTKDVDPGTADNITEKNVNGPNISGDVQADS